MSRRRLSTTGLLLSSWLLGCQLLSNQRSLMTLVSLLRSEQRHIRDELRAHRVLLGIELPEEEGLRIVQ